MKKTQVMKPFFTATHEGDDAIEASTDGEVVIIKIDTGDDFEFVVMDIADFEAIIWNWNCLQEENKKKGGN